MLLASALSRTAIELGRRGSRSTCTAEGPRARCVPGARGARPMRARAARRSSFASNSRLTTPESTSPVTDEMTDGFRVAQPRDRAWLALSGDNECGIQASPEQRGVAASIPRRDDERRVAAAKTRDLVRHVVHRARVRRRITGERARVVELPVLAVQSARRARAREGSGR